MKAWTDQHKEENSSGSTFAHFASEIQVNGLKYIGRDDVSKIRKIIWAILLITSFAIMIYHVFLLIRSYLLYPTKLNMEVVSSSELTFPTIIICNENGLRHSKIKELEIKYNMTNTTSIMSAIKNVYIRGSASKEYEDALNWTDIHYYAAHSRKKTILKCSFRGSDCANDDHLDMVYYNLKFCLRFAGPKKKHISQIYPGLQNGISFKLNADYEEYFHSYDMGVGFRLSSLDENSLPQTSNRGTRISPGEVTTIYLTKTVIKRQGHPFGSCGERPLKYFEKYSTDNCITECEIDTVLPICNCSHIVVQDGVSNVTNLTSETIQRNLAVLEICFDYLEYTVLHTLPADDIFTFFCNIGGAFALLLGTTFLTFYELLEYCVVYLSKKRCHCRIKRSP